MIKRIIIIIKALYVSLSVYDLENVVHLWGRDAEEINNMDHQKKQEKQQMIGSRRG